MFVDHPMKKRNFVRLLVALVTSVVRKSYHRPFAGWIVKYVIRTDIDRIDG